jgi:hypothetical protein
MWTLLYELPASLNLLRGGLSLSSLKRFSGNIKGLKVRDVVKTISGLWLEKRYGWDNLLRDLEAIILCAKRVSEHMSYLETTVGRYVPIHSRRVDEVAFPGYPKFPIDLSSGGSTNKLCISSLKAKRTLGFGLEIKRDQNFRIASKAKYIAQFLGATAIAETIWDVIPLSFVLDWLIDVTQLTKTGPISWHRYDLRRLGYSTKLEYLAEVYSETYPTSPGGGAPKKTSAVQLETVYKDYSRTPGMPPGSLGGLFGNARLVNLADGAALIMQRLL